MNEEDYSLLLEEQNVLESSLKQKLFDDFVSSCKMYLYKYGSPKLVCDMIGCTGPFYMFSTKKDLLEALVFVEENR
jgi:hypothetical protein